MSALFAAEKWGVPPWEITGEPLTGWTRVKWILRKNFVDGEMAKRREREERKREAATRSRKR